jgi:hypothetical protein
LEEKKIKREGHNLLGNDYTKQLAKHLMAQQAQADEAAAKAKKERETREKEGPLFFERLFQAVGKYVNDANKLTHEDILSFLVLSKTSFKITAPGPPRESMITVSYEPNSALIQIDLSVSSNQKHNTLTPKITEFGFGYGGQLQTAEDVAEACLDWVTQRKAMA